MAAAVIAVAEPRIGILARAMRGSGRWRRGTGMAVRPVLLGAVLLALYLWVHAQTLDSIEIRALDP